MHNIDQLREILRNAKSLQTKVFIDGLNDYYVTHLADKESITIVLLNSACITLKKGLIYSSLNSKKDCITILA